MMSNNSTTVEDTKNAEVTDESCTVAFMEIVPLERPSDNYRTSELTHPNIVPPPVDLQQVKQEVADENDDGDPYYTVKQEPVDEYETEGLCFTQQVSSVRIIFNCCLQ